MCGENINVTLGSGNTEGVKAVELSETKGLRWRDVSLGEMLA